MSSPVSADGQDPLVAVVTPVHNGGEYIAECIESVLRQTYSNWVFTAFDNASTDDTGDIVARFAERDPRVRYQRFDDLVGANENHNRAFRALPAESEFAKVVQADDWIYPECLERMVAVARTRETVGVIGAFRLQQSVVDLVGLPYGESVVSGRRVLAQSLTGGPYVTGSPTALMFRTRFVRERELFFLDGYEHADTEAVYWLLSEHDFGYVHQVLTFTRRQEGARLNWARRMSTYLPENIRFLLKYGPGSLEPARYRAQLRLELKRYVWFHSKQTIRPSRFADREFIAVHRAEVDRILADGGANDREVRTAMALVKTMLLRGGPKTENSTAALSR